VVVTQRTRRELANRAHDVLGAEPAETLMELLPPAGWGDVVTTEALDAKLAVLTARMDARFAAVDTRFAELRAELHEELRRLQFTVLTANGVLAGIVTAVVAVLG
jgi:hypothetical protein